MTRRRGWWLLLIGAAILVVAVAAAALRLSQQPRPSRETFVLVKEGMTRERVIATVGGPPANYSTEWEVFTENWAPSEVWHTDDFALAVTFDREGRAERMVLYDYSSLPWTRPSFFQRVRQSLGL
jgi:hypothetical protein